jgi:two-component system sensor histidine kinase VicK
VEVEGEPLLVAADPDRVEQVLWALLDNAVKYSPTGSTIAVRITPGPPQGDRGPTDALLTVTDAGTGMDELTRDHAFDQFYRSETARQLAPDGSGIGLFAARGLIRAMGGDISIASQLGKGTVVTLTLPAEQAERLAHVE